MCPDKMQCVQELKSTDLTNRHDFAKWVRIQMEDPVEISVFGWYTRHTFHLVKVLTCVTAVYKQETIYIVQLKTASQCKSNNAVLFYLDTHHRSFFSSKKYLVTNFELFLSQVMQSAAKLFEHL